LFAVKGEVFRAIVVHSRANHGANEEKIIRNDGEIKEVSDVKKKKKKIGVQCSQHPPTKLSKTPNNPLHHVENHHHKH